MTDRHFFVTDRGALTDLKPRPNIMWESGHFFDTKTDTHLITNIVFQILRFYPNITTFDGGQGRNKHKRHKEQFSWFTRGTNWPWRCLDFSHFPHHSFPSTSYLCGWQPHWSFVTLKFQSTPWISHKDFITPSGAPTAILTYRVIFSLVSPRKDHPFLTPARIFVDTPLLTPSTDIFPGDTAFGGPPFWWTPPGGTPRVWGWFY